MFLEFNRPDDNGPIALHVDNIVRVFKSPNKRDLCAHILTSAGTADYDAPNTVRVIESYEQVMEMIAKARGLARSSTFSFFESTPKEEPCPTSDPPKEQSPPA